MKTVELRKDDIDSSFSAWTILKSTDNHIFIPPRFEQLDLSELEIKGDSDTNSPTVTLFSSGSSGLPKKILLKKEKLLRNSHDSINVFGITSSSCVLIVASPWHVAGFTWGAAAEIIGADVHFFVPYVEQLGQIDELINHVKPTHLFTIPGALRNFYTKKWFVPEVIVGGAALIPEDYDKLITRTAQLTQAYGQTEAGGLISYYRKEIQSFTEQDVSNVGIRPTFVEVQIKGEQNNEIWLKSTTSIGDRPYFTGDLGFIDEHNQLHISGRVASHQGNCNSLTGITMVAHK